MESTGYWYCDIIGSGDCIRRSGVKDHTYQSDNH